MEKGNKQRSTQ